MALLYSNISYYIKISGNMRGKKSFIFSKAHNIMVRFMLKPANITIPCRYLSVESTLIGRSSAPERPNLDEKWHYQPKWNILMRRATNVKYHLQGVPRGSPGGSSGCVLYKILSNTHMYLAYLKMKSDTCVKVKSWYFCKLYIFFLTTQKIQIEIELG